MKGAIQFVYVALVGGLVGIAFATMKRRREIDLASLERFQQLYGQWFAVWKEWQHACERGGSQAAQAELARRASDSEGGMEALLVKIATERRLSKKQRENLGRFREGYQRLRESIEEGSDLQWYVQSRDESQTGEYVAFKALSVEFLALLSRSAWYRPSSWLRPTLVESRKAFVHITSWRVAAGESKSEWWRSAGDLEAQSNALKRLQRLS